MSTFELNYNMRGEDRKRLVAAISEVTGSKAKYLGMPSAAYQVDQFTITKTGSVLFDNSADCAETERLVQQLAERGFEAEYDDTFATQPPIGGPEPLEDCPPAYSTPEANDTVGLTITLPLDKVNLGNLTNLLDAKGKLIQKALGITRTPIELGKETVSFPWFDTMPTPDEAKAYGSFICKLCSMTRNQQRVSRTEKEVDNEKYAFRCFLLRLGFIGAEYKTERKILLSKLTGSSAFKSGNPKVQEYVERIESDPELYDDVMSLQDEEVSA